MKINLGALIFLNFIPNTSVMNFKVFLCLKLNRLVLLLVLSILIFSCNNKDNFAGVTEDNLEEKIHKAYLEAEKNYTTEAAVSVLFFIEQNKITFTDPCIKIKVFHLKHAVKYFSSKFDPLDIFENNLKEIGLEACDDSSLKSSVYIMVGLVYTSGYKNHKMAEKYIYNAIEVAEANDDGSFIVNGYNNLGVNQERLNNIEEAIDASKKAIAAINKYDVKKYMVKHLYNNIANSYLQIKEYDLAKQALDSAFTAYKTIGEVNQTLQSSRFFRGYYLWNRNYYKGVGNLDKAYKYALLSDSLRTISIRKSLRTIKKMTSDEVNLKDELLISNKEKLKSRNIILILIGLLLFAICLFFYKTYKLSLKLRANIKEKEVLNDKLKENLQEIEINNKDLVAGKAKIESLLRQNDQIIFSKTLKLSNYKDAVENVINNVDKIVESNSKVDVSKLFFINKYLKEILSEEEIWEDFKLQFEKNRPNFFEKLLKINSSLSIVEQKHCAYVVINLKSKEVASILSLSPRSVETTRYRIKKKLNLTDQSLYDFLTSI